MHTTFGFEPQYNTESCDLVVEAIVRKIMSQVAITKSASDTTVSTETEETASLSTLSEDTTISSDSKKSRSSSSKSKSKKMRKSKKSSSSTKDKKKNSKAKSSEKNIIPIEKLLAELHDIEQEEKKRDDPSGSTEGQHGIPHIPSNILVSSRALSNKTLVYNPSDDDDKSTTLSCLAINTMVSPATTILGYDNVLPSLVMTNATTSPMMYDDAKQRQQQHIEEEEDLLLLTRGQESCSTVCSFNSASTSSTASPPPPPPPSRSRRKSRKSKRRSRQQQQQSKSMVAVFDPSRMPERSSMKMKKDSSTSNSSSCDDRRRRRQRRAGEIIKVYLPGKREPVRRQRSVQFDEEVTVRKIQSAKSLANNDPCTLWYQEYEEDDIKRNIRKLLDRVNHAGISSTNGRKYCMRGLERFMNPEECRVKRAQDAVLTEQYLQREDADFDDEQLADIYRLSTRRCQREATRRGSEDAIIAKAEFSVSSKSSSRSSQQKQRLGGHSFHHPKRSQSHGGGLSRSASTK